MDGFPVLPGLSWSVLRTPRFATRIQTSISGRETRVADMPWPIWTWTLTYEFLRDTNDITFGPTARSLGTGYQELRTLMGFYARQQGSFGTWLYNDTSDNATTNQGIGLGDGSTNQFQLQRTLNSSTGALFIEPITQPGTITGVYVNGSLVTYTPLPYGVIQLTLTPPPGAIVSASFTYFWPCRFTDDSAEFENFMFGLWTMKKLTFQSVILP